MSNAPWAGTGYGQQTKLLLPALQDLGHSPHCFAFYGLSGGCVEYDGYTVWPNSDFETWGNDVIKLHVERSKADAVITLMDLFVLNQSVWAQLSKPWLAWTPIDAVGIGEVTLDMLRTCAFPVAMSKFGANQMMDAGIEPAATIYHAVDTNIFKPMDKSECREVLGIPDDEYIVGMVMANKGDRKQYPLQIQAVKRWADKNPDINIKIYIHTEPTAAMGGWDMRQLVKSIGFQGRVYSTNQYDTSVVPASPQLMATIYNGMDVLMNCSAGEGFGIPIIEAQACGVPVITHGVTAMPEITHYGYTVESVSDLMGGHFGWQYVPSTEEIEYRLECVYRYASQTWAMAGRQWVERHCSLPVIADQWSELLAALES